ncbi:hypothetical protein [Streptomyces massasporeus]|uniref:hypothetical protein n=1 Tax=Streptomyces massasporeus TaxID=67324 RepID=UPI003316874E
MREDKPMVGADPVRGDATLLAYEPLHAGTPQPVVPRGAPFGAVADIAVDAMSGWADLEGEDGPAER